MTEITHYMDLKLAALGFFPPYAPSAAGTESSRTCDGEHHTLMELSAEVIYSLKERTRLLSGKLNPVDAIIQDFLDDYFSGLPGEKLQLPATTLTMDRVGMARVASLPKNGDHFKNDVIDSYRIQQGVLHNPVNDRRTTKGTFHIATGGLPVPYDKIETPPLAFARLFQAAMNPPADLMTLPYTTDQGVEPARTFVSLLLRPVVRPFVPGVFTRKSMAIRFFAPASLVSNLDFVESIFGNGGDPELAENNPRLDIDHWSGHTGCVILAPHLTKIRKVDLGLPHISEATERQKRDGMCYENVEEAYNDGTPFKLTVRNEKGVVVTLIADNYFGYSKKEVKTQISYAANLMGLTEEEHAGGTLAFPRRGIQGTFLGDLFYQKFSNPYTFQEISEIYKDSIQVQSEGYGIDKNHPEIIYIPEDSFIDIYSGWITWNKQGKQQRIRISPDYSYVYPTGHRLRMEKNQKTGDWQLFSTDPEGAFLHKPATVSGGGKSEISKKLDNAIRYGAFHVENLEKDFEQVEKIINHDFSDRWKDQKERTRPSRPLLSRERTLGSVVKLLTPSRLYTQQYNEFLRSIPYQVRALVFFIKHFYRKERHGDWRGHLGVDTINGREGHDLKFNGRRITASYLRMGFAPDGTWFLHTLRPDFAPASRIQMEDDITASITMPVDKLSGLNEHYPFTGAKIVENCEMRFFQRPDEAIHPGYDTDAERDLSSEDLFVTNFEPLSKEQVKDIVSSSIDFDEYSLPMQEAMLKFLKSDHSYMIVSSKPRIVDGKPTKNPRYLQTRHTHQSRSDEYLAEMGVRLARKIKPDRSIFYPVNAILSSRRNNPADPSGSVRSLAVYNPIHYQELPELFMDYISSLTGKSPSTTGAGSEGALTKGPFNMLVPTTDLNNALLSMILTGYQGFTTAAGYVGEKIRFDHDISIFIPEVWARLREEEKDPAKLIQEGSLEKVEDFHYEGKTVLASRLGYRITEGFLFRYFNRVFSEPQAVFTDWMLRPEKQNLAAFADGISNIVEAHERVARGYFEDGSVHACIPPLKALLHMMVHGEYEGMTIDSPDFRKMFDRAEVMESDWYRERLKIKQAIDENHYLKRIQDLEQYILIPGNEEITKRLDLEGRLATAKRKLARVTSDEYLFDLTGTIGADPLFRGF